MTTINSYSVSLTMDASSYIKKSILSRKETRQLTSTINAARSPAEKQAKAVDLITKAYKRGAIDVKTYNRLLAEQKKRFSTGTSAVKKMAAALGKVAAAYVGFHSVKGVIASSIELAADAQQTNTAFKVMLGNAEHAAVVLRDLRDFAKRTPFELSDIQQSGRQLLAFGFSADQVIPQLTVLGNLAAGTGQRMSELADLVGKARVQNTIFSEDLNQLTGRGINVLDGLARRLGTTTAEVKKFAADGKIAFSDLNAVLTELSENNFGGLMAEQSENIKGQWSTIKDEVRAVSLMLGNDILPALKTMMEIAGPIVRNLGTGLKVLTQPRAGGVAGGIIGNYAREQAVMMNAIAEEEKFQKRQTSLSTPSVKVGMQMFRAQLAAAADMSGVNNMNVFGGLAGQGSFAERLTMGDATGGGIDTLIEGAKKIGDVITAVRESAIGIAFSGTANTKELIAKTTNDPAIKSLEANTQEAYSFMTSALEEVATAAGADEARQKQLEANEEAWKQKVGQWQEKVLDALANNGFKRIR